MSFSQNLGLHKCFHESWLEIAPSGRDEAHHGCNQEQNYLTVLEPFNCGPGVAMTLCRYLRRTMSQLAATAIIENAVIGQWSEPRGAKTLLRLALSPAATSTIGRMQQEQAAKTAAELLMMLTTVVLPSCKGSGSTA